MLFALAAFIVFVIAAILAWTAGDRAAAIAYAGLALLALHAVWPVPLWARRTG